MSRIVTITLNPAVDVYATVGRVAPGVKLRCAQERRDPGGGGINVARVVRRLGGDALAIYTSGGAIGSLLEHMILSEGVQALETPIAGQTRESFTVVENESLHEFRFVLPGPQFNQQDLQRVLDVFACLAPRFPLYLVASGSLPPGAPGDSYAQIATLAKQRGSRFVVDAGGAALRAALESGAVYLAKPSLSEFEEYVGHRLETHAAIIEAASACIAAGQAEIIVVTLAARGAIVVTANEILSAAAIPTPAVSSIGAGDSFLAAMLWALDSGCDLAQSLRYGLAAGAASLLAPGTQLCAQEDVLRLLGQAHLQPDRRGDAPIATV